MYRLPGVVPIPFCCSGIHPLISIGFSDSTGQIPPSGRSCRGVSTAAVSASCHSAVLSPIGDSAGSVWITAVLTDDPLRFAHAEPTPTWGLGVLIPQCRGESWSCRGSARCSTTRALTAVIPAVSGLLIVTYGVISFRVYCLL